MMLCYSSSIIIYLSLLSIQIHLLFGPLEYREFSWTEMQSVTLRAFINQLLLGNLSPYSEFYQQDWQWLLFLSRSIREVLLYCGVKWFNPSLFIFLQHYTSCILSIPNISETCTIIVSLVTPGKTRSSMLGVIIYLAPVLGFFTTKKIFDVPTSPILPP